MELLAACFVTNGPIFYRLLTVKIRSRNAIGTTKSPSPCIIPRPADTVLTLPDTGTSTNGGSSFGRSANNSSGKTRRTEDDDLELAERPAEKDLTTDTEIWEVDGHHSQEFLKVN